MATRFDLIEIMRFDAEEGIVEIERHIARMGTSAKALDFVFNRHDVRNELHAATFHLRDHARVTLRLSPSGRVAIEARPWAAQAGPVTVTIVPLPLDPGDLRLGHKTSYRFALDRARASAGTFEVIFERPDGLLTEGSFTTLFVPKGDRLVTPPLKRGLMPGVLRASLLDSGEAVEGDLTADDLADGFQIGNALQGLIAARLA